MKSYFKELLGIDEIKNYRGILGIDKSETEYHDLDEIKKILSKEYHPDVNTHKTSQENLDYFTAIMQDVNEAHCVLSNEDKRKEYDSKKVLRYKKSAIDIAYKAGVINNDQLPHNLLGSKRKNKRADIGKAVVVGTLVGIGIYNNFKRK